MVYEVFRPRPELAEYVSHFTFHVGYEPSYRVARYLPDGGLQIVIDMTDDPKFIFDRSEARPIQKCRRTWVSGMRTDYLSIGVGDVSSMFVIEFRPGAKLPLFRFPMSEIANTVVDGDAVFGPSIDLLRDEIRNAPDNASRFESAERWLMMRIDRRPDSYGVVRTAARLLREKPAMATVDHIVSHSGVSHKHMIDRFRDVIGVTPKQYQRIHRFQSVIRSIETRHKVRWSELALDCGYYDQSHFVNEFKRFSGINPTDYLFTRRQLVESQRHRTSNGDGDELNWVPVVPR